MVDDRVGWSGRLRPTDGEAEGGRGRGMVGVHGDGSEERTGRKEGGKQREAKRMRREGGRGGW